MGGKNKKYNKHIFGFLYWFCSILIPVAIILASDLVPKDTTTWVFATVIVMLYVIGLCLASKIIKINTEINKIIIQNDNSKDTMSDEEMFKNIEVLIEYGKNNQYKNIYNSYYNYKKSLRGISEEDAFGQDRRKLYAIYSASNFFDEDNIIYKNLYYKTINYITQALTGIGIFGTFLGIVQGISGLDMGNAEVMKQGISNLLTGVKLSFSTSLYGILLSVVLTFVLKISIEATMKKCDKLCDLLDRIVPKSNDKEGFNELEKELKKQTLSIEKLATDLADEMGKKFNTSMQENLAKLTKDLSIFVDKMENSFINSMSKTNELTTSALNSNLQPTLQKLETVMNSIQAQQEQSSIKFIEESMHAMKEIINIGTNDEMEKLKSTMDIISAKNLEMVETFTCSMENMKMLTLHQEDLIKNTTTSTENINITTENIKELQDNLGLVIQSLKDVSSNNNISLTNIQDTIESMKDSMSKQLMISKSVESMVDKTVNLTQVQDQYISKLDKMSKVLDSNIENTQKYILDVSNSISEYKNYFENIKESTTDIISAKNLEIVGIFNASMENMKMLTLHQENLIKNTATSTENMNVTTENIKELQDNLNGVIQGIKDISNNNNVSLVNIQDTIESMKDSMSKQLMINKSVGNMVDKTVNLTQAQDQYISKLDKMSKALECNIENAEKYISNVTNGISEYKNYFEDIKISTIEIANALDCKYKDIVNDLSLVNENLAITVESVDKNIINQVQLLVKDLDAYQIKTTSLIDKIEKFAEVEESTQELWMDYKESFETLNEAITDGIENYNKHMNEGVTEVLSQFDNNISEAIRNLKIVAETLCESAEEISTNLEVISVIENTKED